jgi:hypothetical protein
VGSLSIIEWDVSKFERDTSRAMTFHRNVWKWFDLGIARAIRYCSKFQLSNSYLTDDLFLMVGSVSDARSK